MQSSVEFSVVIVSPAPSQILAAIFASVPSLPVFMTISDTAEKKNNVCVYRYI